MGESLFKEEEQTVGRKRNDCEKAVPTGGGLFWCERWDSKGRPERSEGKKHAGGMFFRPWESPFSKKKSKQWWRVKSFRRFITAFQPDFQRPFAMEVLQ